MINDGEASSSSLVPVLLNEGRDNLSVQEALRQWEDRFHTYVSMVSDAVFRMSADWSQLLILESRSFLDATDKPDSNWLAKYIPTADHSLVRATSKEAVQTKKNIELEHRVLRADGTLGWAFSRATPLLDEQGEILEWFGAVTDITRRKQSEEALHKSEKRIRIAVEAAHLATWEWHLRAGAVYWNEQHFRLLGMAEQAQPLHPNDFLSHIHPDDRQSVTDKLMQAVKERGVYKADFRIVREDGEICWMSGYGRITEVIDGQATQMHGVMFDITDRKLAELSLKESNQRKNEFLALLAHELRNPMATLQNTLLILGMIGGADERLPLETALDMMNREMGHLVRLVDDLLDVSRIHMAKIQLRLVPLEFTELVQQAAQAARQLVEIGQRQFYITLPDEPLFVNGDATRLTQIVRNLLSNATKFTLDGGHIWLILERIENEAVLRVRDNGIGIAADQLTRIFALFSQVDASRTRSRGGLGLGLTLTKEFAELHGGGVEVHSRGVGEGSEFVVRLPLLARKLI